MPHCKTLEEMRALRCAVTRPEEVTPVAVVPVLPTAVAYVPVAYLPVTTAVECPRHRPCATPACEPCAYYPYSCPQNRSVRDWCRACASRRLFPEIRCAP